MGGFNEKTVEQAPPAAKGRGSKQKTVGKIRIHENSGQVHFHDDANGLKVAVPFDKFVAVWSRNHDLKPILLVDNERGTFVEISFGDPKAVESGRVEARVVLGTVAPNDTFKNLNDFALGR